MPTTRGDLYPFLSESRSDDVSIAESSIAHLDLIGIATGNHVADLRPFACHGLHSLVRCREKMAFNRAKQQIVTGAKLLEGPDQESVLLWGPVIQIVRTVQHEAIPEQHPSCGQPCEGNANKSESTVRGTG